MSVLFLDLGSNMGWALRTGGVTASGTWPLKANRFEGGGMRFLRLRWNLDEIARNTPVKAMYYEEVRRHQGVDAAHVYGGMWGMVTSWCEDNKIPYEGVPVQAIKKFVTGKGNATKEAVIAAVKSFGFNPADDNEADALALMLLKLEDAGVQALL